MAHCAMAVVTDRVIGAPFAIGEESTRKRSRAEEGIDLSNGRSRSDVLYQHSAAMEMAPQNCLRIIPNPAVEYSPPSLDVCSFETFPRGFTNSLTTANANMSVDHTSIRSATR